MPFRDELPPITPDEREIKSAQIVREHAKPIAPALMDCDAKEIAWMALRNLQKQVDVLTTKLQILEMRKVK